MRDRYYIWEDEERSGPYTERQVGRMLEDGVITFAHECEHAGNGETVMLDELFEPFDEEDEEEPEEDGEWEYEDEEEEEEGEEGEDAENDDEEWEYEDEAAAGEADGDEEEWDESEEEEWDEGDEEWEETEEEEEWEDEEAGLPARAILYHGHPTFLRYVGGFALAALGVAFGWWLGPRNLWFFVGGFGVSALTLIAIIIDRSTRLYTVTPRRVELDWGLFARSSREVRIEDIRTINVKKSGIGGLLGVGTVEFSSTGDGVDVSFTDIWGAKRVKMLVRELQDELE